MFYNKPKLVNIKCIVSGEVKNRRAWYHCGICQINYSVNVFPEYDGWLRRPSCALCSGILARKTVQLFTPHRRR